MNDVAGYGDLPDSFKNHVFVEADNSLSIIGHVVR